MARSAQDAVDTFRVFLRNLPLAFLEPDLEKLCGEYGPTKRIDLIKSMHSDGSKTSKGYAFVKFALEEDAKKAARALNGSDVMGRRIIAELALRKGAKRPEAQPYGRRVGAEAAAGAKMEEAVIDSAPPAAVAPKSEVADGDDVDGAVTTPADAAKPEPQTEQPLHLRTVFAFGIPDDLNKKQLFKRLRKLASVLEVSLGDGPDAAVPKGQTARVVCKSKADAIKLRSKLDGKTMHSHSVMARREVELALWNGALDSRKLKKFRLIVRNLPWEAAEEHLSRAFGKHGPLQEVHIPTVEVSFERKNRLSGEMETVQKVKSRGFAFIQYLCRTDAERVVKDHGVLDILGRSAAVDFALAKKSFEEKPDAPPGGSEPAMDGIEEEGDPDAQEQGEEDDDMDQDDVTGDSGSSDEEEEEKGDDDDDEEEDDEEEEDEDGSSDPKEEADAESSVALQKKKKQISRSNDVAEGCTVFVRNLPFDAESEALRNVFEGRFGPVVHALIVKDKRTGLNKGSAFVKFKNSESVATCIQAGCSGVGISLEDGRPLYVSLAVDREEASKFSAEGAKSHRELVDRRLLYLANEGLLIPDAAAASATPQADMDKRAKARAEKKKKLANPLFFISPLRLSIRNLASGVDDSKLKNVINACSNPFLVHIAAPHVISRYPATDMPRSCTSRNAAGQGGRGR
jgi:nucleolar protein 4